MPSILLSGPAGSGKSQRAREILQEASEPTILADFQSIVEAITGAERVNGKYPVRPEWVLPIAEYLRRATITQARQRGLSIVATNSDGSPDRRAFLLGELGPDAREVVHDPGRAVVAARLADAVTGELSFECQNAIDRWYVRV